MWECIRDDKEKPWNLNCIQLRRKEKKRMDEVVENEKKKSSVKITKERPNLNSPLFYPTARLFPRKKKTQKKTKKSKNGCQTLPRTSLVIANKKSFIILIFVSLEKPLKISSICRNFTKKKLILKNVYKRVDKWRKNLFFGSNALIWLVEN